MINELADDRLRAWARDLAARDPRWQQAAGDLARNDRDHLGSSVLYQVRQAAVDEMYRIELAYEAPPALIPPVSFELTPVHDPARCRHRRLTAMLAEAEGLAGELAARVNRGEMDLDRYDVAMGPLSLRIDRYRATIRRIGRG